MKFPASSKTNSVTDHCLAVFTVCNINYLPRALVLAESVKIFTGHLLKIVLFDRKISFSYPENLAEIIWIEDLKVPNLYQLAMTYDIIEFSTSLKPFIALHILNCFDSVIFLDPDTRLFSSIDSIEKDLIKHPIVLTPHYLKPQPSAEDESDLGMMRFGSFNLGFFAVKKSEEGINFLRWWSDRCIAYSYMESQFGLSTDQKWVSIAPCFYPNLHVSFNSGYNMAPWNTFERKIIQFSDGTYYLEDGSPLIFFHFSNFDYSDPQYLHKRASSEKNISYFFLEKIGIDYSSALKEMTSSVGKVPYSFDFMSDGSYISPTLRRAYASIRRELPDVHNPFDSAGQVGLFASKNHLLEKNNAKYIYPGLNEVIKHSKKFLIVYFFMRQALRVLGPNRFYDLSKLMVYLSIYRKNPNFWKLK